MDRTINNISQLEKALQKMKRPSEASTPNPSISSNSPMLTPLHMDNDISNLIDKQNIKQESNYSEDAFHTPQQENYKSLPRTSTSQVSTAGQLLNLASLQTLNNLKIDKLTDAIYALHNSIERNNREQVKQTELLATIARNTVAISSISSSSGSQGSNAKANTLTIKDYGFNTNNQLFAEFIMGMLKQVKMQMTGKGRQYRSIRDLTIADLTRVIDMAKSNTFKINGISEEPIVAQGLKIGAFIEVAKRIGGTNGEKPILNGEAYREIFDNSECTVFVRHIERLMERLRIIRILIPFYEADIINHIQYPYFNKTGEAICDWSEVNPRAERTNETLAMNASIDSKKQIAKILAKGISEKAAISAAIQSA